MCCKGHWGGGCWVRHTIKVLLLVGGLNWGLVGLGMLMGVEGGCNVVNMLLSSVSTVEAVVYLLVGVAAVAKIFGCCCKKCKEACAECEVHSSGGEGQKM